MKEIITDEEFETKMERLGDIFYSEPGTPEGEEAKTLTKQIMAYHSVRYPQWTIVGNTHNGNFKSTMTES